MKKDIIKLLQDAITKKETLSKKWILEYIENFISLYQAQTSLQNIHFAKTYGYDDTTSNLYIAPTYFGERQQHFLKTHHEEDNITLKTLFTFYMLHHELAHILQNDFLMKDKYLDTFFKEELKKSLFICELDINHLHKQYYQKFHDRFLFEANANMFALIVNDIVLQSLDIEKELYNEYAASIIAHTYHNNVCPVVYSDFVCEKIIKKLQQKNANIPSISISQNPYTYIEPESLSVAIEKGYPIDNSTYQYFVEVANGKKKVKSLFQESTIK